MNMTLELFGHSHNLTIVDHSLKQVLISKAIKELGSFEQVACKNFKMEGETKSRGQNKYKLAKSEKENKTYNKVKVLFVKAVFVIIALLCNCKIN